MRLAAAALGLFLLLGCAPSTNDLAARGELGLLHVRMQQAPESVHNRDVWGKTPLHTAVSFRQIEAMDLLVRAGADLNAVDITGLTPIHVAAMLGRQSELAWLLRHGANASARDELGDTPLHTAARYGMGGCIAALVEAGLRLDGKNNAGETPLQLALAGRHERVAKFLEYLAERK